MLTTGAISLVELPSVKKQRNTSLGVLLGLFIVIDTVGLFSQCLPLQVAFSPELQESFPAYAVPGMLGFAIYKVIENALFLVCEIALLNLKKWAFNSFCALAVLQMVVQIAFGLNPILSIVMPLGSILLLYYALHLGKENKGWPQLD